MLVELDLLLLVLAVFTSYTRQTCYASKLAKIVIIAVLNAMQPKNF